MKSILRPAIACLKFKQGGGCERYVLDLIRGFHQKNIIPTVYASYFEQSLEEYQWIEAKKAFISFIPNKLRLPFLSKFIAKNRTCDEIVLSVTHTLADIIICGGQHIGYLHAIKKSPSLLEKYKIYHEKKCFNASKVIIAHSELMKRELIQFYQINEDKIKVIYPPVNLQHFYPIHHKARLALRQKFGFRDDQILYLFPSTGHVRKGFDLLKNYFNRSDQPIKLVVAGTPVAESRNVISLGFRQDIADLYRMADFTIMASIYEPFGLVGIESILSGTPVVFSNNMACLETFKDGFGFSFERKDPNSFEQAVSSSIKLAQQGKHRIQDPLSIINYDPALTQHILQLERIMESIA